MMNCQFELLRGFGDLRKNLIIVYLNNPFERQTNIVICLAAIDAII